MGTPARPLANGRPPVRDVDLPDGPGSRLVRGFAACLASVTGAPLADLPPLADGDPFTHARGAWKAWLAGRGSGLAPIADPRSSQWAGSWIAVVDGSDSAPADGPLRQVSALAFGTPPGIVLSPQALLRPLIHRGGLRVDVPTDGTITPGCPIAT